MYVRAEVIVPTITLRKKNAREHFSALAEKKKQKKHMKDELEHFIDPSEAQYRPTESLSPEEYTQAVLTSPPEET